MKEWELVRMNIDQTRGYFFNWTKVSEINTISDYSEGIMTDFSMVIICSERVGKNDILIDIYRCPYLKYFDLKIEHLRDESKVVKLKYKLNQNL